MRKRPLIALTLLAFALRMAVVAACASVECPTYEHGAIARNLLAGRGFSIELLGTFGPTAQQGPLYPGALAVLYALCGVGAHAAHLLLQIGQCALGAAAAPAVVWLGWSLWPARREVGWMAGGLVACHPVLIYMVTHVQVVTSVTTLLALLAAAAFAGAGRTGRSAALAGLAAGTLLLLEPILALALPWLAAAWWQQSERPLRARAAWLGAAALACSVTLAPWLARNYRVFGEVVFVKSTFAYAFWQGNNPASWGTDKIPKSTVEPLRLAHDGTPASRHRALAEARSETLYIDDVLLKPEGYRGLEAGSEPQRCRVLGRRAAQFVRQEPARYLGLCARRLWYFLLFDPTNPKTAEPLYRAATAGWLALVAIGLASRQTDWRRAWPLAGMLATVATFHVLTITSARFRIPLEALTMPWAACALRPAWDLAVRRRQPRKRLADPAPVEPQAESWRRAA